MRLRDFKFTIREVIMLTLIVGLLLGWIYSQAQISGLTTERDAYKSLAADHKRRLDELHPGWNEPQPGAIRFQEYRDVSFAEWLRSWLPF